MPRIQRLSAHDAQKIAAGQVIERPADIIKELVENSIDAQANHIAVYVEEAGKKLIRVVDDGCGMDVHDARMCFEKHATSKLNTIDQLNTINTFGFRGEAMPSIAAVCKVTLITRTAESTEGVKVESTENVIHSVDTVSAPIGTDISAADLFYTMPARQKFLKKTETEWRHILQLMQAFCLDYPTITFKVFADGKQVIHCPAVDSIINRFAQLWDHTISAHMLDLSAQKETGSLRITGAISDHQQFRFDRNHIFIFINNRWVKNFKLTNALIKGYMNVAPAGRYPIACIALTIDPSLVDVNIHPRKEEVSFVHPVVVENFIKEAVKTRLEENVTAYSKTRTVEFATAQKTTPATAGSTPRFFNDFPQPSPLFGAKAGKPIHPQIAYTNHTPTPAYTPFNFDATLEESQSPTVTFTQTPLPTKLPTDPDHQEAPLEQTLSDARLIGQYHKTYLLIEQDDGLFLIDQHAAHERILYEKLKTQFADIATVSLLFPQLIPLSSQDLATLEPLLPVLEQVGIHTEPFGTQQLKINALPVIIKDSNIRELIEQTIGWIHENSDFEPLLLTSTIQEKLRAQMACKAAVKAGDILTEQQMNQLLLDLRATENRLTCPHGRPTGWLLSLHDIEKKFKRKT